AATAAILKVIASSPNDVQPVFNTIVLAAVGLLGCDIVYFLRCDVATFATVAIAGPNGLLKPRDTASGPIDPNANFPSRAIVSPKTLHLRDWSKIELPPFEQRLQKIRRLNCSLYLPMLREGKCIGVLAIGSKRANHFDNHDIALAESFRDQAV